MMEQLLAVEPRRLLAALGTLVLLALAAGWLYVLKPSYVEWRKLAEQRALLEQGAPASAPAPAVADIEAREVARLRTELARASGVDGKHTLPRLVGELDVTSRATGARLGLVAPTSAATKTELFEENGYEVEAQGKYRALATWLAGVEERVQPLVVGAARFVAAGEGDEVSLKLRLSDYRLVQKQAAP